MKKFYFESISSGITSSSETWEVQISQGRIHAEYGDEKGDNSVRCRFPKTPATPYGYLLFNGQQIPCTNTGIVTSSSYKDEKEEYEGPWEGPEPSTLIIRGTKRFWVVPPEE